MIKSELVQAIANETSLTPVQVDFVIDMFMHTVKDQLKKGQDVKLVGFGTFERTKRNTRAGRNPQTGESIEIKAAFYPKFRVSPIFKMAIR